MARKALVLSAAPQTRSTNLDLQLYTLRQGTCCNVEKSCSTKALSLENPEYRAASASQRLISYFPNCISQLYLSVPQLSPGN